MWIEAHGGSWRSPTTSVMPRPDSSVVERGPEKAGVGGSIPSLATTSKSQQIPWNPDIIENRDVWGISSSIEMQPHPLTSGGNWGQHWGQLRYF
jgi:hypothetical protein